MARHLTEYVSEFTQFMNDYLAQHPEVIADQHVGRAMYWDKQIDMAEVEKTERNAVPLEAYSYFGNVAPHETRLPNEKRGRNTER